MSYPLDVMVKGKNFKCFADEPQGYDAIYPINIIIGRNNSGKSALLDMIKYLCSYYDNTELGHKHKTAEILLTHKISEQEISRVFDRNVSGGLIGGNHYEYGMKWLNKPITISIRWNGGNVTNRLYDITPPFTSPDIKKQFGDNLSSVVINPFQNIIFSRLFADRNIKPEPDQGPALTENGDGATNIIQNFINKAQWNKYRAKEQLLVGIK